MCGIVAYVGKRPAAPLLVKGLKALEYRGYDSAGIAVLAKDSVFLEKCAGRITALEKRLANSKLQMANSVQSGIGHSRWATHGAPTDTNAHPHADCLGNIFVVHNGIIENYQELKTELIKQGHHFSSETDTEVVVHLIENQKSKNKKQKLEQAILKVLPFIRGTYALGVISKDEPEKLVVARNFSPLLVGIGKGEFFAASDATPILPYTKRVIYLKDGEVAVLTKRGVKVFDKVTNQHVKKKTSLIDWDVKAAEKGGFTHFLLKEIFEIPEAIENAMRGRNLFEKGFVKFGGVERYKEKLRRIKKLHIVACGSASFAAKVGEYLVEEFAGLPCEVDTGSEFRYRKQPLDPKNEAILVISQSGETADTIAALDLAHSQGLLSLGIVNVVGSTVARKTDAGIFQYAGPEISVATTKAFVSQLAILSLFAIWLGVLRGTLSKRDSKKLLYGLHLLPAKAREILKMSSRIRKIALLFKDYKNFLYVGRKYSLPIALEGALKLKEISYIHAEAYGAGEMKHGPIALINKNFPTVAVVPDDSVYEKTLSNLQEIKARSGPIIAVTFAGDKKIAKLADEVLGVPQTLEQFSPILTIIPLQLFAYYVAVARGCDVDKPRNLAKSVTVE